jgi:hypothetical protein
MEQLFDTRPVDLIHGLEVLGIGIGIGLFLVLEIEKLVRHLFFREKVIRR